MRACVVIELDDRDSHGIRALGDVEVAYAWHPWAGQAVRVYEVIERTSGAVTRCSLVDDCVSRAQEIPVWMLDGASCRTMRGAAHPVTDLSALIALRALLFDVAAAQVSAKEGRELALVSPDQNFGGDHHGAPSPPPNPHAEPSARLARSGPGGRAQRKPGVELVAAPTNSAVPLTDLVTLLLVEHVGSEDARSAELRR